MRIKWNGSRSCLVGYLGFRFRERIWNVIEACQSCSSSFGTLLPTCAIANAHYSYTTPTNSQSPIYTRILEQIIKCRFLFPVLNNIAIVNNIADFFLVFFKYYISHYITYVQRNMSPMTSPNKIEDRFEVGGVSATSTVLGQNVNR